MSTAEMVQQTLESGKQVRLSCMPWADFLKLLADLGEIKTRVHISQRQLLKK